MVVRSVVRRSRLKELGVGGTKFSAAGVPVPVGATVQIPSDKKIKVTVTFENTGSKTVSGLFWFNVYYARTLSDSSGDPETDRDTWDSEKEASDSWFDINTYTLNPGDSLTRDGMTPVTIADIEGWSEGDKIDAGVVLYLQIDTTVYYLDSLKITDAVEIVAPTLRVEITDVSFSEA